MTSYLRYVFSPTPILPSNGPILGRLLSRLTIRYPLMRLSSTKTQSESPPLTTSIKHDIVSHSLPAITPGSQHHSSLSTFLAHATRTSLSPTSNVYIGTHYEYTVLRALAPLGFTLTRTGRTSDNGIDLLGTWTVPSHPLPLRVLVQCKSHARALKPEHVRELEGAFGGAPAGWRGDGVLGFLVSPKTTSKGVREALGRSKWPVGYFMIDGNGNVGDNGTASMAGEFTRNGKVRQLLWNHEAAKNGLEGLGVTVRHGEKTGIENGVAREVALMWNGRVITRTEGEEGGDLEELVVEKQVVKNKRGRPRKDTTVTVVAEQIPDPHQETRRNKDGSVRKKPGPRKKG